MDFDENLNEGRILHVYENGHEEYNHSLIPGKGLNWPLTFQAFIGYSLCELTQSVSSSFEKSIIHHLSQKMPGEYFDKKYFVYLH